MREILLQLDEDDWNTIQSEMSLCQARRMDDGNGGTVPLLPEGESNLPGAIVAECIRDLNDYRERWTPKINPNSHWRDGIPPV